MWGEEMDGQMQVEWEGGWRGEQVRCKRDRKQTSEYMAWVIE